VTIRSNVKFNSSINIQTQQGWEARHSVWGYWFQLLGLDSTYAFAPVLYTARPQSMFSERLHCEACVGSLCRSRSSCRNTEGTVNTARRGSVVKGQSWLL